MPARTPASPGNRSGKPAADEQHLILQAKQGSHEAYRLLVERHMKQAYDVAFGFVGNHQNAEDITQEAFVRAYQSLRRFRGEAEFSTWLYRIIMNLSFNRLKQIKRRSKYEARDVDPSSLVSTEVRNEFGGFDLRPHIERALHELPTLQRAVVILRHLDGLSTAQVSSILRCSEGTVKTHLFRGLKKLRSKLAFLKSELA
jgi:RNA polymerase sigma-70 factor (ECF subfamily)